MKILKKQFRDKCCHRVATASNATFPAKTVGSRRPQWYSWRTRDVDAKDSRTDETIYPSPCSNQYFTPMSLVKWLKQTYSFSKVSKITTKMYFKNPQFNLKTFKNDSKQRRFYESVCWSDIQYYEKIKENYILSSQFRLGFINIWRKILELIVIIVILLLQTFYIFYLNFVVQHMPS